ncbi:MAG: hypothetical protein FWG68_11820 [Defluviitaleaceae bacterium]|nr:hypothetical protein [Defluviitaleaceae bacterium]
MNEKTREKPSFDDSAPADGSSLPQDGETIGEYVARLEKIVSTNNNEKSLEQAIS